MSPAEQIAALRRGLHFASPTRQTEIKAKIAALEMAAPSTQHLTERVAACDLESKAPGTVAGAGSSSEAKTRQRAAAAPLASGPVERSRADTEAATVGAGGSPAPRAFPVQTRSLAEVKPPARCALEGCDQPVRPSRGTGPTRYCSPEHAKTAKDRQTAESQARHYAETRAARAAAPVRHDAEHGATRKTRREQRPHFRLTFDPSVKIRPPLPAPVRCDADGVPTPFQDDLRAIRDHGSPGPLWAPEIGQARRSILA